MGSGSVTKSDSIVFILLKGTKKQEGQNVRFDRTVW